MFHYQATVKRDRYIGDQRLAVERFVRVPDVSRTAQQVAGWQQDAEARLPVSIAVS